jgi:hypothetical protein
VKNGSNPQIGMKTLHRLRGIAWGIAREKEMSR